jgi:translation initiation factor 3 subunit B
VIVVDNLPKVPQAKVGKLSTVLRKIFGQIGVVREDGLVMPTDAQTGDTKGFAFVEFGNANEAAGGARADGWVQARQGARVQGVQV